MGCTIFQMGSYRNTLESLMLVAILFFSGCAGMVTDKRDVVVRVLTDPPAAVVVANGNHYLTPASILMPRGEGEFSIQVVKKGYHSETILLVPADEPSIGFNLLNLCVGCVVDVLNGSAYSLEPREIHLVLRKE